MCGCVCVCVCVWGGGVGTGYKKKFVCVIRPDLFTHRKSFSFFLFFFSSSIFEFELVMLVYSFPVESTTRLTPDVFVT